MDGASEWTILRAIVFPLAAPGMATLAIFTLIGAWNDFLWPLIVTDSDSVRTLPVGLALLARRNTVVWGRQWQARCSRWPRWWSPSWSSSGGSSRG